MSTIPQEHGQESWFRIKLKLREGKAFIQGPLCTQTFLLCHRRVGAIRTLGCSRLTRDKWGAELQSESSSQRQELLLGG